MPAHGSNRKDLNTSSSSGGGAVSPGRLPRDKSVFLPSAAPAVTGIDYPSRIDTATELDSRKYYYQQSSMSSSHQSQANHNRLYSLPNTGGSAIDDANDPPANTVSLDDVWSTIRKKKERQMAKEKPKVQSLEEVVAEQVVSSPPVQEESPDVRIPVMESHMSPTKSIKKQKSMCVSD